MAQITFYCEEMPGFKLGPGVSIKFNHEGALASGDVIVFSDGFASFEDEEFRDWRRWKDHPGTPTIRVIDEAAGEPTEAKGAVACPVCERALKSKGVQDSHLRTHAPG